MCWALDVAGDHMQVAYHRYSALRCYLLFLVGTSMFVDKSETYVDVVYLKYITDLSLIHEYNWGAPVWSTYTRRWMRIVFGRQSR